MAPKFRPASGPGGRRKRRGIGVGDGRRPCPGQGKLAAGAANVLLMPGRPSAASVACGGRPLPPGWVSSGARATGPTGRSLMRARRIGIRSRPRGLAGPGGDRWRRWRRRWHTRRFRARFCGHARAVGLFFLVAAAGGRGGRGCAWFQVDRGRVLRVGGRGVPGCPRPPRRPPCPGRQPAVPLPRPALLPRVRGSRRPGRPPAERHRVARQAEPSAGGGGRRRLRRAPVRRPSGSLGGGETKTARFLALVAEEHGPLAGIPCHRWRGSAPCSPPRSA